METKGYWKSKLLEGLLNMRHYLVTELIFQTLVYQFITENRDKLNAWDWDYTLGFLKNTKSHVQIKNCYSTEIFSNICVFN